MSHASILSRGIEVLLFFILYSSPIIAKDCSNCPGLRESESWCHSWGPCIASQDCSMIIECAKGQSRSPYETHHFGYYYQLPLKNCYILAHWVSFEVGIGANIQVFIEENKLGRPEVQVDAFGTNHIIDERVKASVGLSKFWPPFTEGFGHFHYFEKFYTRNVIHWNWPSAHTHRDDAVIGVSIIGTLLGLSCHQTTRNGLYERPIWHLSPDLHLWENVTSSVQKRHSWSKLTKFLHLDESEEHRRATCTVLTAVYKRSVFHATCGVNFSRNIALHDECTYV